MWWRNNKKYLIPIIGYIGATLFSLLFCSIYYIFSRGLRSNYMTYMFLVPLGYVLLHLILWIIKYERGYYAKVALANSCALIILYLALSGIYEMAYMGSAWLWAFLLFAGFFLLFALLSEIIRRKKGK